MPPIADRDFERLRKLPEHPPLVGGWPPNRAGLSANTHPGPTDSLDTLKAFHRTMKEEARLRGIILGTSHDEQR